MMASLADGDILKIQEVMKLPIRGILGHLVYIKSGGIKTNAQKSN